MAKVDLNKSLVSLEVLQLPPELETVEEIEEFYNKNVTVKTFLLDDTSVPYVVRIATADKRQIRALDPEFLPDIDTYEISESIQEILRSENFPVFKHKFPQKEEESISGDIKINIPEKVEVAYEVRSKKVGSKKVEKLSDIFYPNVEDDNGE